MESVFGSIRKETVLSVLSASLSDSYVTRLDIAKATGLSVMTVGKVVDALARAGILSESLFPSNGRGRRSRFVHADSTKWSAIVFLCDSICSFSICSTDGTILENFDKDITNEIFADSAIASLLSLYQKCDSLSYNVQNCVGIAVIVSGKYDSVSDKITDSVKLSSIKLEKLLSDAKIPDAAIFSREALYCISPEVNTLNLFIDKGNFSVSSGKIFRNVSNLEYNGKAFAGIMKRQTPPTEIAAAVSQFLLPIVLTSTIDKIYVTVNLFSDSSLITAMIREALAESLMNLGISLPEFVPCDSRKEITRKATAYLMKNYVLSRYFGH